MTTRECRWCGHEAEESAFKRRRCPECKKKIPGPAPGTGGRPKQLRQGHVHYVQVPTDRQEWMDEILEEHPEMTYSTLLRIGLTLARNLGGADPRRFVDEIERFVDITDAQRAS